MQVAIQNIVFAFIRAGLLASMGLNPKHAENSKSPGDYISALCQLGH